MARRGGNPRISIQADADSVDRATRQAAGDLDRLRKSGEKSLHGLRTAAAVAGAALTGAVVVGGAKVVEMASDIDESLAKNQQLFGKHAKAVDNWSRGTAESMGISRQAALEAAGVFGNLFVALDLGPKKSADMSKALVTLAGDLASFNNASPEEAMEAIRSGLVGETEPLRRFGVNLNDAALRAEALKLGLVKTTKEALTPQQKALAVNKLLFEQTDKAQGDFQRTSEGLANQQRILKADLSDVGAEAGKVLLPAVKDVASAMVDLVEGFRDGTGTGGQIKTVISGLGDVASSTFNAVRDLARGFQDGEPKARLFAAALIGVATGFAAFKVGGAVIAGIDATKKAWLALAGPQGAIAKSPIGVIAVVAAGLIGALGILSAKTRDNEVSARAFNDALRAQRDAMREVQGIELDEAQRKANLKSATVAVEQAEKRLHDVRKNKKSTDLDIKQAEADLRQARISQKRASVDLANAEEDAKDKRQRLKDATVDTKKEQDKLNDSVDDSIRKRQKEIDGIDDAIGRLKNEAVQNDATRATVKKLRDRQRELNDEINSLKSKKVDVSVRFRLTPSPGSVYGSGGIGDGVGRSVQKLAQSAADSGRLLPVGPSSLMGADPDLAPFASIAAGMGLRTSSGLRPGAITSSGNRSYHASGDAIDESGPPGAMMRFATTMRDMFGGRLAELIYTPMGVGIKNGRPYRYSGQVAQDHYDHVHVAYTGPFGDGEGQPGVVKAFRRAIRTTNANRLEQLALWEAGIVESGLRNLHYGDADSLGALQERTSIYGREHALDPYRSALRFLRQAKRLRPWNRSAGMLAQAVQRSRYPGRYDAVKGRALAYLETTGSTRKGDKTPKFGVKFGPQIEDPPPVPAGELVGDNTLPDKDTSSGSGGGDNSAAILALVDEMRRTREFNAWMVNTQGPQLVGAVTAYVNSGLGARLGSGLQGIRSPVGSVAGY